jgi:hypothetical protein
MSFSFHVESDFVWGSSWIGGEDFRTAAGIDLRMTGDSESAGINRHVVGDARALQERK